MNYNINIREESFGATVFNLVTGKRFYVTKEELRRILTENIFPEEKMVDKLNGEFNIKYTSFDEINEGHFSFADIAYVELTRNCNLRCLHCLNSSGHVLPNQLNHEDFVKLVEEYSKLGIQEIRFTGGEPLVYKNIYELISLCTSKGIYTSIGTNGTLITLEVAEKLKQAGLKKAIVSLDGTIEKHDYIRGEGNYVKTMAAIKNLKSVGIDIRVNSVILKSNIDDVIQLAKELHCAKIPLFIRRFIESGRGVDFSNNMLTAEDYVYVRQQLKYELENGNYVNGHYLKNDDEAINSRIELPFTINEGCKAGQRALVITPDGDIHLCGFLAAQGFPSVGNVKEVQDWLKFWNNIHIKDRLIHLRNELEKYNEISGIQKTNCLAYVQRHLNR